MKAVRIIVLIVFIIAAAASAVVFISNKVVTDTTLPVIKVSGDLIEVSLEATDEELLKGVTAYDEKDKDLTDKIIVESISKFTEKGISKVTYAVCDSDNNVTKATRNIKFKDYVSPRFRVEKNLCFSIYERIDLSTSIRAHDCIEGGLNESIIITSESYSTSVAGVYSIDVSVTNKKGDTSTVKLPLIIEDRPLSAPEIELTEYLIYAEKGENIDFSSYIVDALDYSEVSLKENVTIESTVDFNKEGTYHVHYYVTDINGFRGHTVMTVIIGE